jgi:dienelactone hydrolase
MSLIAELKRRNVFRVGVAYAIVAWVLIQVVDTIFPAFGLDDAAFRMLVIVLAIGFVPVVILAWAFELTKEGLVPDRGDRQSQDENLPSVMAVLRRPVFAVPLCLAALAAAGTIYTLYMQLQESREARQQLVPRIEALIAAENLDAAYGLALEAEEDLPDDPMLKRLIDSVAVTMSFISEPAGADVSYRRYTPGDGEWVSLGVTPIESVRLPRDVLQWRVERPGFEVAVRSGESFNGTYRFELVEGELPEGMVRVPTATRDFLLTGFVLELLEVPQFLTDRNEVSNEDFSIFVTEGGYVNESYWSHLEFVRDGVELTWDEAVDFFRDHTGRLGPATWEGGTFPEGAAQLPVTGISWFEAAAYARYRGKQLPTIYHWSSMSIYPSEEEVLTDAESPGFGLFRSELAALSNFSDESVAPVGQHLAASPFGAYDVAGNVREWSWNATGDSPESERYILGGSWQDPTYLYTYGVAKSPWGRSEVNGVRLVGYDDAVDGVARLRDPKPLPAKETLAPVSDEVFQVYRDLYGYDRTPLNAEIETVADDSTYWTQETVSFDATYDDERVFAHVFLPRNIEPPYQVVVYYPSSDATYYRSSDNLELGVVDFIIKSGRAVVIPVLMGTYERNIGLDTTWPKNTREYSDHVVKWIQDFRRTADYLETRVDMDLERLGYFGFSWGGWNGPIVLALDERFKTGVFVSGGIPPTLARPEASSASFASRVTQPVLMISGKDDVLRPVATYQAPMFESLGTPDELKRHAILDGGHSPPVEQVNRESLEWFDRYLGTVE